jgi:hypothetical protein
VNYTIPSFVFAGETYNTIGLVSNGYMVVGGGTGGDVVFESQVMPDPSAPNNVIAPMWTDLNPDAGGEIRIAVLTDGVSDWTVIEYSQLPNWGDGELNSFQVWIGANGVHDVSFAYGPEVSNGDDGIRSGIGAENSTGESGQMWWTREADGVETGTAPVAGGELRVDAIPGSPGGSHTISFWVEQLGGVGWENCAEMTSDVFFGANIACFATQ